MPTEPTTRRRVAFIFPIYNEEANIDVLHRTVDEVTAPLAGRYDFSFLYVDDGSRDGSLARLTDLAERSLPEPVRKRLYPLQALCAISC